MDKSILLTIVAIVVLAVVVILLLTRKKNPKMMRRQRPPLMLGRGNNRNGRVVAPPVKQERFVDQYTMNVPIGVENPLWMNSVPDGNNNPWISSIPGSY